MGTFLMFFLLQNTIFKGKFQNFKGSFMSLTAKP